METTKEAHQIRHAEKKSFTFTWPMRYDPVDPLLQFSMRRLKSNPS